MRSYLSLLACVLVFIGSAQARTVGYTKDNPRTVIKCFVKLTDDSRGIYYAAMPVNDVPFLKKTLVGQFLTGETASDRKEINKVLECVHQDDSFTKRKARKMDEENAR